MEESSTFEEIDPIEEILSPKEFGSEVFQINSELENRSSKKFLKEEKNRSKRSKRANLEPPVFLTFRRSTNKLEDKIGLRQSQGGDLIMPLTSEIIEETHVNETNWNLKIDKPVNKLIQFQMGGTRSKNINIIKPEEKKKGRSSIETKSTSEGMIQKKQWSIHKNNENPTISMMKNNLQIGRKNKQSIENKLDHKSNLICIENKPNTNIQRKATILGDISKYKDSYLKKIDPQKVKKNFFKSNI